jgi:hypothetical protein
MNQSVCTLGRATLPSPEYVRQEGGDLRIGHSGFPFEGDSGMVMAAQVNGYPTPDEPVIPFTYGTALAFREQDRLDGYYFVESTKVDWVKLASGVFSWEAQLVRTPGFQAPLFEVLTSGAQRASAAVTADTWVAYPEEATMVQFAGGGSGSLVTLEAEEGLVHLTTHGSAFAEDTVLMMLEPDIFYQNACRIEHWLDGFQVVTDRQIPNDPTEAWRIGNGLVRMTLDSVGRPQVQHWDNVAAAWENKSYKVVYDGVTATNIGAPSTITILRNSPVSVSVRVGWSLEDSPRTVVYGDFTLHRGSPIVDCRLFTIGGDTKSLGVFLQTGEASTSYTGGIGATGDDAAGNRYQILCNTTANTKSTGSGGVYLTSVGEVLYFGLANDFQLPTTSDLAEMWAMAMRFRQRISAR